jgi:hypothetical protein
MYDCVHTQAILSSLIYFSKKLCLGDTSSCYTTYPQYGHGKSMWGANDKGFRPCVRTLVKELQCIFRSRAVEEESCCLLGEMVSMLRKIVLLSPTGPSRRKSTHPDDDGTKFLRRFENPRPTAQRNVFSSAADCSLKRRVTNDVTSPVFRQFVNRVSWDASVGD